MRTKTALSITALIALTLTGCNVGGDDDTECDTIVTSAVSIPAPRPAPAPRAPSMTKPTAPKVRPSTPKVPANPSAPHVHTICHEENN